MKKTLLITIGLVVIVVMAIVAWLTKGTEEVIPEEQLVGDTLPFGSGENLPITTPEEELAAIAEENSLMFDAQGRPVTELFRISDAPIAGSVVINRGGMSRVRYVDRATGHVYEVTLPSATSTSSIEKARLTNTTLVKIYEAHFRPDGGAALLRSLPEDLDTVENMSITLIPPSSTSTPSETGGLYDISAANLRGDMGSVSVVGNNLIYTANDSQSVVSSNFAGGALKTLFTSPFTEWVVIPFGTNVILQTKAASNLPGYAYTLNTANNSFTKLLGPLAGLSVISDSAANRILYSYSDNGQVKAATKNLRTNAIFEIYPSTLAEKCVWSTKRSGILLCAVPQGGLTPGEPDYWYRGQSFFSDGIWEFDSNQELAQVLLEPRITFDLELDALDLKLSPNEDYLIFTNKRDLTLWAFKLPQI